MKTLNDVIFEVSDFRQNYPDIFKNFGSIQYASDEFIAYNIFNLMKTNDKLHVYQAILEVFR